MAPTTPAPAWLRSLLESQERRHSEAMVQMQSIMSFHNTQISAIHSSNENQPKEKNINVQRPSTLNLDINYSQFTEWRESWNDYALLIKLHNLPEENQRALLRCCMSEEMRAHLKCAIEIDRDTSLSVDEILNKIQDHLRNKINVTLDRVAFVERKQAEGESFDSFYVALKKLASDADICIECRSQRITTQIVAGVKSQDLRQNSLQ